MDSPSFSTQLLAPPTPNVDGRWGVLINFTGGSLILGLGYEPFSYQLLSPCCGDFVVPANDTGVVPEGCYSCQTHWTFPVREIWEEQAVATALEAYGETLNWWADPLEAALVCAALRKNLSIVGKESNGRRSVPSYQWADRARTIDAGLKMLEREHGLRSLPGWRSYDLGLPSVKEKPRG